MSSLQNVTIQHHTIFSHATATLNYTSYDVTEDHDSIKSRQDIMLRACDNGHHSFWYARVLGIYHTNVFFGGRPATRSARTYGFFFVRWFGYDPEWQGGPGMCKLDRIGWVPENDPSGAFGFLDPARVIRACHLIPAFTYGKTTDLLALSQARDFSTVDWVNYYVSRYVLTRTVDSLMLDLLTCTLRFVDRDMMMRYLGWGIGHRNPPDFTHEANMLIASNLDRELEQYGSPSTSPESHPNSDCAEGDGVERESVGSESDLGHGRDSDAESIHSEVDTYDY
jgi:hypothetical protein